MEDIFVYGAVLIVLGNWLKAISIIQSISYKYTGLCQPCCCVPSKSIFRPSSYLNTSAFTSCWDKTVIAVRGFLPLFRNRVKGKIKGNGHTS